MVFAFFRIGVIPVFIDPGMDKKDLLNCIKETNATGLVAETKVHLLKVLYPKIFQSIKLSVTSGKITFLKMKSIHRMKKEKVLLSKTIDHNPEDTAAILFTSGEMGRPKGVVYTHQMFHAQATAMQKIFPLTSDDVDLSGFPLFSLFTIAIGLKSCIPDIAPQCPAKCAPKKLVKNIFDHSPSFVSGSPSIWESVADYCIANKLVLPSIKYIVMFGAPVSVSLHEKFVGLLPNGTTYAAYGAIEALPISNISGQFILKNTASLTNGGRGICLGYPSDDVQVKIIQATDEAIDQMENIDILPTNHIGEIIVKGLVVTSEYMLLSEETRHAHIIDNQDNIATFWHRMGDVGFIDEKGLLWFCGRKSHSVYTAKNILYPIQCEAIFNQHPEVRRSALVGIGPKGSEIPAIVIERKDDHFLQGKSRSIFEGELLAIAKKYPHTSDISHIYFSRFLPVDARHNIKIDRLKLKAEIEAREI
jgi:acyl-CoA synthetase (AMP-forming)/AMP-acid ligase II